MPRLDRLCRRWPARNGPRRFRSATGVQPWRIDPIRSGFGHRMQPVDLGVLARAPGPIARPLSYRSRPGMIRPVARASLELLLAVEHEEGVAGCTAIARTAPLAERWRERRLGHDGAALHVRGTAQRLGLRGFLPADATRVLARDAHAAWSEAGSGTASGSRSRAPCRSPRASRTRAGASCRAHWMRSSASPCRTRRRHARRAAHPPGTWRCCRRFIRRERAPRRRLPALRAPGGHGYVVCEPRRRQRDEPATAG